MRTTPKNGKKKVVYKKKVEHMSRSCPICSLQGITTLYARVSDYIWRKHSCRPSRRSSFRPSKGPPLADERTANAGITSAQHLRQTDIKDRGSLD
ncbi:hypothetical protein DPMN_129611 [Dreissena polymorpha]|uniref:Uncharacterized protein n=1 Tax=Dreissena polymorpha TaxID=45954 RepID=A0A9D4H1H3_DREPO|nr:hypothetical protein DPMN_129611 [Dreissena polymorpha]